MTLLEASMQVFVAAKNSEASLQTVEAAKDSEASLQAFKASTRFTLRPQRTENCHLSIRLQSSSAKLSLLSARRQPRRYKDEI